MQTHTLSQRYASQMTVPSPFAQFSSATMEEHQHTLDKLNAQLEMIARALSDLEGEEIRHSHEHSRSIETLSKEQDELVRRVFQSGEMAKSCVAHAREEEARMEAQLSACAIEQEELVTELRQLEDLEQQMIELEQSASDRLMVTRKQLAQFTQALRDGLDVLETDAREVRRIMTTANLTQTQVNLATQASIDRTTPNFDQHPTRSDSLLRPVAPSPARPRPAVGDIVSPERSGRQSRFMRSATLHNSSKPSELRENREDPTSLIIPGAADLLEACARVPMDPNEVTFLLRQNQAAVNALDGLDNTPLHLACMNATPSLDAVHALLLAGANTSLKNAAGLTPFHLACLNHRGDPSHQLKKFLIFKGAQNPNQRTSRGETAAHLCAEDDKHFDSLVFLIGAGVDAAAPALLSGPDGATKRMSALDVAKAGGQRSLKCTEFLRSHCGF